jgi:hypothetical protein
MTTGMMDIRFTVERVSLKSLDELVNATLEVDIRRRLTYPLLYIKMFRLGTRPL